MAKRTTTDVYQIKITLDHTKPPIWRRFLVPADITLDRLHDVIQGVMGWTDSHLHAFEIKGETYQAKSRDGVDMGMDGWDEKKFCLGDLVTAKAKFHYQYDFGDSWDHTLSVEKILPATDNPAAFTCLAGAGRCPPDDCGGIPGYYHLLDVLNNPDDPEHEEMMEWADGKIDPEEFDVEAVNKAMAAFRGRGG